MSSDTPSDNIGDATKQDGVGTYEGALKALLDSPLHQAKTKEALEKTAARRVHTISDMHTYMDRIQLTVPTSLKVVHVTGTKGKGSTCCLCESILRQHYGLRTGLYTSPHLVDIRERIRINGQPVSKAVFAQVYWEVRQRLETTENHDSSDTEDLPVLPGYFRMLTLMALFTFAHYSPSLDVIILEVGMGGRYDATNVLDILGRRVVCGVTLLDLDHTRVLGDTLEQIAWEKGGIFQIKKGEAAMETHDNKASKEDESFFILDSNTKSVIAVFEKCAKEEGRGSKLRLVGDSSKQIPEDVVIGLPGDHQRSNAELAVALSEAISQDNSNNKRKTQDNSQSLYKALESASWPGRCQTVTLPDLPSIHLRLDGSHTPISLQAGYDWYCQVSASQSVPTTQILVFNCSHERNPVELLQLLLPTTKNQDGSCQTLFTKAYFCRSDFARPSAITKQSAKELLTRQGHTVQSSLLPKEQGAEVVTWQRTLESIWKHLEATAQVEETAQTVANLTVKEALDCITKEHPDNTTTTSKVEVFVAGSLYIVGSALNAIQWSEEEAHGCLKLH